MSNRILNRDEIIDVLLSTLETSIMEINTLRNLIDMMDFDRTDNSVEYLKRYSKTMEDLANSNWKLFNSQLRKIDNYPIDSQQ